MLKLIKIILIVLFFSLANESFAHSQVQLVEMTTAGFSPDTVTVDESSTVIFLNNDSVPRWPASNNHPTHGIYKEFDPKEPIPPGKSWSFKPKPGKWRYHDHLLPHQRGIIEVTTEISSTKVSEESLIQKINNFFISLKTKLLNFLPNFKLVKAEFKTVDKAEFKKLSQLKQAEYISRLADNGGATQTWDYLKNTFKGEGGSSGNIHDLAHLAGSLIFQSSGFEGLGNCGREFAFGCYHGFLDEAFKKDLNHLITAEEACLELGSESSGPVASCIHGIGHGVASFYLTKDLEGALTSCRKLNSGEVFCFDGVFMEFVRNAPESLFKNDDPLYPCNDLEKRFGATYSISCGRNQPTLLINRFNYKINEVVKICLESDSKWFKEACFDSLGYSMVKLGVLEIKEQCRLIGETEYINRCIIAAAGELVFQEVPDWDQKSKEVCMEGDQDKCLENRERIIKEYGKSN